ncbi:unnamed protein product [Callosobruchus maculatus]|nr:unnamed protein product [Callosobruchus maculatus]
MVTPKFVELSKKYPDVVMAKANLDEAEDLGQEYNIQTMPTFILFKRHEVVATYVGADMDRLRKMIDQAKRTLP